MATFDIVGASDDDAAAAYESVSGEAQAGGEQRQRVRANDLPIHFGGAGPLGLAANGSATFTINLNMQLRPDKLVIPDAVAPSVAVASINIGALSLNASSDPAPGDMFRHDTSGKGLRGAVSGNPSVPIKVTIINVTSAAIPPFHVGIEGPSRRVN